MKLNKIVLNGFKSFGESTEIVLDQNLIGIVGPNGSGKSNIIDSIRWVFGEQSNKSLRGNNSADVIFGGTEKRDKQNIAEVTIVLDNTDQHLNIEYDEVAITRRLYRSGNSEYFLNKTECRLKDIIDLTLDKGIGKSAFSIISQGKIEEIILVNPEKRRVVIEEVAGILKYKKRKENTLKKLERTNDNLRQVDLILNEMQDRMGSLERQVKAAKKYNSYKQIIDEHEVDLIANKIHVHKETYEEFNKFIEDSKLNIISLETQETNNELIIQELIGEIQKLSIEINSYNSQIIKLNEELNKLKSDFQILQERKQYETKSSERTIYLENRIFNIKGQIQTVEKDLRIIAPKLQTHRDNQNDVAANVDKLRQQVRDSNQKISRLENELSRISEPFATQKVLQSDIEGIVGSVSKLFKVQNEYVEAITIALGARANDIVVESKENATKAINFLKSNQFGRQTFLPKDMIKPLFVAADVLERLEQFEGYINIGTELIDYDEKNIKIFKYLLGNIIIAKDMRSALHISRNITNRYRIVTLDGDVISPSGTMSGGRFKNRSRLVVESTLEKEREVYQRAVSGLEKLENSFEEQETTKRELETESKLYESILDKNRDELQLLEKELKDLTGTEKIDNIKELDDGIQIIYQKLSEVNEVKTKVELQHKDKNDLLEDKRHSQLEINEQIRKLNTDLNKYEVKNSKLEVEIKNDLSFLSTEYSMSFEEAYQNARKEIDIDEYEQIVVEQKRRIRNLGPVNLLSIAEFDELENRYNFIDVQKADLITAKDKLESIIERLDEFFIESFSDTYARLRIEFQNIFVELFGGGQADLVLTKPDDMLSTGVEIVAQPPGKKLQTISLLSGGEKSLTAIALLFAILRIKKLPFAILDEVEAALDEVNVKRYAKYIKIFSERTQFIVITHRQGTMETVEALYGITMQEKGVSTVVKVKLEQGVNNV